jgi:hypothetical protein
MIAGAVGMVMYAHHWVTKNMIRVEMTKEELEKLREKSND